MTHIDHEAEALRLEQEADRTATSLNSQIDSKDKTIVAVFVLVFATMLAAFCYFMFIGQGELPQNVIDENVAPKERFELRGLFGDQWGAFTGIMSGLSLAFVALSLFAQRVELRMSRRELSMQRLELKYSRAQSHRQINELKKQREEDGRRDKYQKEPVVMVSSIKLVPTESGAEIQFVLDHFGPAACNISILAALADTNSFFLDSPQVLVAPANVSHTLEKSAVNDLTELAEQQRELVLKLTLKYFNLAGGVFFCSQYFRITPFYLKTAFLHKDKSSHNFEPIRIIFEQGPIESEVEH